MSVSSLLVKSLSPLLSSSLVSSPTFYDDRTKCREHYRGTHNDGLELGTSLVVPTVDRR
mgnify:CR=1 FL=1